MRIPIPALAAGVAVASALAGQAQDRDEPIPDVAQLYRASCKGCHPPPDARFETDRAWLHQVLDTA